MHHGISTAVQVDEQEVKCIYCSGPMPRPKGSAHRRYCRTCSQSCKDTDHHICVSPVHDGDRKLPVDKFYIRHSRYGYAAPYPTSYCKECMKRDAIARYRARKEASRNAGTTPQVVG